VTEQTATDSALGAEERLAALLSSPDTDKLEAEAEEQPEEDGEEVVEGEVEADDDESEEAEDGQAEDSEEEADTEEDADGDESDDEDGEDEKSDLIEVGGELLSVDELKLGYLRQSDYTQKTQAVAEQRKAAEEERQYYASTLNSLLSAVGADIQRFEGVDWERAAAENPTQYQQAKAAYEQSTALFNNIKYQTQDFVTRAQEVQKQALKAQAKESISILKTTIPGWSNDLYAQIGEFAREELGFKPEEFNNIADHRAIVSIYEAMQYRRGRKVATEKKIKVAPKRTLTDKRAAKSRNDEDRKTNREARERLRSTGKVDDAVSLLAKRLSR
jgi:hypothetical protein